MKDSEPEISGEDIGWQQATQGGWLLKPGVVAFERFEIERELGRGSHGIVCLALDRALAERVALKFVPDHLRYNPMVMQVIRREVKHTRQLVHPNIVRVFELHEDACFTAIAMEYVPGGSLADLCAARESGVLSHEEIMGWLPDVCSALDYAHREKQVVHRDIKPGNILLTESGRAKVADFGLARSLAEQLSCFSGWQPSGTLAFMGPQQLMGDAPTTTDDIYSLGCLLFAVTCGQPPFVSGHLPSQIMERLPLEPNAARAKIAPTVDPLPVGLETAILACLNKEPGLRPQSGAELLQAVQRSALQRVTRRAAKRLSRRYRRAVPARLLKWTAPVVAAMAVGILMLAGGFFAKEDAAIQPVQPMQAKSLPQAAPPADDLRNPAVAGASGAPSLLFGAVCRGLLIHLPLEQDTLDYSGNGWDATANLVQLTRDRFGRDEHAMRFSGNSHIKLEFPPDHPFSVGRPFAVSLWFKTDLHGGALWSLFPGINPHPYLMMAVIEDYLQLTIGGDYRDQAFKTLPQGITLDHWHYLVCQYDGKDLVIHLDAQEVFREQREISAALATGWSLRMGGFGSRRHHFEGAMNDFRLYRNTIPESQILTNFQMGPQRPRNPDAPFPAELAERFVVSTGFYLESDDLEEAVWREFGEGATVADWEEIREAFYDHGHRFFQTLGMDLGFSAFITRGGNRIFDGNRHYSFFPSDGIMHKNALYHDYTADQELYLGSWHGYNYPVLVRLPDEGPNIQHPAAASTVGHVNLRGEGTYWQWYQERSQDEKDATLHALPGGDPVGFVKELLPAHNFRTLRIQFTGNISYSEWGNQIGVGIILADQQELRFAVAHQPLHRESLSITVTDASGSEKSSYIPALFGEYQFMVMVRDGRIYCSAIGLKTPEVLFERIIELPGLAMADVAAVRWFAHTADPDIQPNWISQLRLTAR